MKAFDVIVVGGGHAGIEAALAASRLGSSVLLMTMNPDTVGMMSCNPAIGGLAKGQMVREIDALGGEMALNIDATGIQFRILNTKKGPAVRSPRAQADKMAYAARMRTVIEHDENILMAMDTATGLDIKNGRITAVKGLYGETYPCRTAVLTPGTFLGGRLFMGDNVYPGGRLGEFPSDRLGTALKELGLPMGRLKTGTPARVDGKTIDFSVMEKQEGDEPPAPFSFKTRTLDVLQVPCYKTRTNSDTHDIIGTNMEKSALFSGNITGVGPRYCPSIEDKIKRFPERDEHQIFVEPEGRYTDEYYLNGISTSLPPKVQESFLHTIKGLEKAEIVRYAYAVEYDFVQPYILRETLETDPIKGLYLAGQINGTSGYEEAAGQGLVAGANAALSIQGKEPFTLGRDEAYIGVLIDDLITKSTDEPYRMFTSRAEYRLILRSDNADERLAEKGYRYGLVDDEFYSAVMRKYENINQGCEYLRETGFRTDNTTYAMYNGKKLFDFLKVSGMTMEILNKLGKLEESGIEKDYFNEVEIRAKYDGYIAKAMDDIKKFSRMEKMPLPEDFDYSGIRGLTAEAAEKLNRLKPASIGKASRISGISPADISVLIVYFGKGGRQ